MFDYKEFKKEMAGRGHRVIKKGNRITIFPNNNSIEYSRGFQYFTQVVYGYEDYLHLEYADHCNHIIYELRFKVL